MFFIYSNLQDNIFMVKNDVYVDNNGTTPLREEVCELICRTLRSGWANPSSQSEDAFVVSY